MAAAAAHAAPNEGGRTRSVRRRNVLHLALGDFVLPTVFLLRAADLEWFNQDAVALYTELVELLQARVPRLLEQHNAVVKKSSKKRPETVARSKSLRCSCSFEEAETHRHLSVLMLRGGRPYRTLKVELVVAVTPLAADHAAVAEEAKGKAKKRRRAAKKPAAQSAGGGT